MSRNRICLVAHFAYGALSGATGHIGGVEWQVSLMARWLARQGYTVSVLTWDEGQAEDVEIDGVHVLKMCRQDAGVKGLRFFWPKWTSLNAAMKRADADLYYQNCGEYVTGQVALWCRRHGRRFVYSVANDPDCDVRLPEMQKRRERILYRYGLGHADQVIVQTRRQQKMLWRGFGRDSVVIPMPCPGPSDVEYTEAMRERNGSQRVLWIGRICEQKRPDRLLDLAEACPDLRFDLVGPTTDTEYTRRVCERAKALGNVTFHGPAAREHVSAFYRQAKVLCCTSDFEGFPNTFLEAWSWGVPVVSTFDPDALIAEKRLGRVGKDVAALTAGIREMLTAPNRWQAASRAARKYYTENHAMEVAMNKFEQIFRGVADAPDHL
jgi:glycosyltransferase involved in cell wall biosynthesis